MVSLIFSLSPYLFSLALIFRVAPAGCRMGYPTQAIQAKNIRKVNDFQLFVKLVHFSACFFLSLFNSFVWVHSLGGKLKLVF